MPRRKSLKRRGMAVVFLLFLGALTPFGAAWAGEGSGAAAPANAAGSTRPAGSAAASTAEPSARSTRATPTTPATPGLALEPLRLELEQLRETVEAQAQLFAKQAQELESERAALADELDRMARLESELRLTPAETPDSLTPVGSPAIADTSVSSSVPGPGGAAAQAVQAQAPPAPPAQGSVDRRLSDLEQRFKKLGPLTFSGDFRLREDAFFGGPSDHSLDQNLQNYRLRFNTDIQLGDDLSGGFTLASGNINDPTSTNQTLTGFYARKPIALDKVFIEYHPGYFKPLSLVAGKFAYPWYNTELTWDKDLNPEGLAQTLNFELKSTPILKRIALVGFELPFAQVAGVSLQNKSLMQTAVYGGQFQTAWQLANWLDFTAYTGFYDFQNADPIALALAKADAKDPATPFIGLLPLAGGGGTPQNSITTTTATAVVTVGGTAVPTGVTTVANAQFASKFGLFDSIARFDVKTPRARWPIALIGDYVQNTEACANAGNILRAPANTAATQYSQSTNFACDPRQRRGYWAEVEVGRILQKRDLQFGYTRMFIEREAVLSNFNYNQMYQGSNVTEHRFSVFYTLRNNVIFDFIGLFGRPLNFGNPNPPIDSLKRLQFDVNYVF
jgi:hypothetical protein